MIEATPGSAFRANTDGFDPGLAGTLGVRVKNPATGVDHLPRTVAGISELIAASGTYTKGDFIAPTDPGDYVIAWDALGTFKSETLRVRAIQAPLLAPDDHDILVMSGDDYDRNDGREFVYVEPESAPWPDLTDAIVSFTAKATTTTDRFAKAGRVITPQAPDRSVGIEMTALETAGFDPVIYQYTIEATLETDNMVTLVEGRMRVKPQP
jgi:hypothetical protein